MEFDPATVLLGAVVLLQVALLIGSGILREEIERLYSDVEQAEDEAAHLRAVLMRIAELLARFP